MTLDLTSYKVADLETSDHNKFNNLLDAIQAAVVALQTAPPATPVPTGTLADYGAAAAPTGWLLCDGTAVSRTTYADLFAIIGTTYGSGDGSTTFNVPDMRGRVPVGYAASGGHTDVSTLGNNDGVSAANRRAKHRHTAHSHTYWVDGSGVSGSAGGSGGATNAHTTGTADGGSGISTDSLDAPAYLVVNRIIKT